MGYNMQTNRQVTVTKFEEAVRYFVMQMRTNRFNIAHHALLKKYGSDMCIEVEQHCVRDMITRHSTCGRIVLVEGYERRLP